MRVHPSAPKHGVDPDDALIAASDPVYVADLDQDSPARQFRLGFDSTGRLLELIEAADDKQLSRVINRYARLDLLCLDEVGYALDTRGAELLLDGPGQGRGSGLHRFSEGALAQDLVDQSTGAGQQEN